MQFHITRVEETIYEGKVYERWIYGFLKSGREIVLTDIQKDSLSGMEGSTIECLISLFINNIVKFEQKTAGLSGTFVERFDFSSEFPILYERLSNRLLCLTKSLKAIKTEDGIFLLSPDQVPNDIRDGGQIWIEHVRYDLFAWK